VKHVAEHSAKTSGIASASIVAIEPVSPMEMFDVLLAGADPRNVLPIATLKPTMTNRSPHPVPLLPVPLDQWRHLLPRVLADIASESIFVIFTTLTSLACPIAQKDKSIQWFGKRIWFRATSENAKEMLSIVIDLDVGRAMRPTATEAIVEVVRLCSTGELPPPTFILESGRGIHLHYALSESASGERRPPHVTAATRAKRESVLNRLFSALDRLFPDQQSYNVVQYFKCPKATNGPTCARVIAKGSPRTYWTLDELLAFWPADTTPSIARPVTPRRRAQRRSAKQTAAPMRRRVAELWSIARAHLIVDGCRNNALMVFIDAQRRVLRSTGLKLSEIEMRLRDAAHSFCDLMLPPLSQSEITAKLRSAAAKRPHKNVTIARYLGITEADAKRLGLKSIIPPALHAAREKARLAKAAAKAKLREQCDGLLWEGVPAARVARFLGMPASTVRTRAKQLRNRK
jgi:hypothetical protein